MITSLDSRPFKLVRAATLVGALHRTKEVRDRATQEVVQIQAELIQRHRSALAREILTNPRGDETPTFIMSPVDIWIRQDEARKMHISAVGWKNART